MRIVCVLLAALLAGCLSVSCALFTGGQTAEVAPPDRQSPRARPKTGLSTAEVERHGATIVKRPFTEVFEACSDALRALGYRIAVSKPKRGLLITGRLRVGRETATLGFWLADGIAGTTTQTVSYSRQYTLHLKALGPGRTWVAAVPGVYAGDQEISRRVRWQLHGLFGERARWQRLFLKVRELLPERRQPGKPSPPRERHVPPPAD